ncbi:GNAT family N-acetyltransferase [Curtobacterium sp. MCBD17_032]|uniref:GNAT family N-acetyltransferase n=1 Tax=Curtobacterium sp. MCBD17_032 TaxID=2175659 RepID=UPI0015E8803E|nr:GNAT family N-acetyltransferase [Curtobacterium sp. MCBD17_032]
MRDGLAVPFRDGLLLLRADRDGVQDALRRDWLGDWTLDRFERALSGSWIVCTVRDDAGRLVGMGRLISDGALHAFVTEMIVTEEARGGGIGGQVLARLVDEARRRGVDDVQLFAARGRAEFYERHGFERRAESGPGMDVASVR